jgi:AAA domain
MSGNEVDALRMMLEDVEDRGRGAFSARCPACGGDGLWVTPAIAAFRCNRCEFEGSALELFDVLQSEPQHSGNRQDIRFLTVNDLRNHPRPEWLVEGGLPKAGIVCLYAPPAHGKTFVLVDLGLSVSTGKDWMGLPVRRGNVVFIAAENGKALGLRVLTWLDFHEIPDPKEFLVVDQPIQLIKPKEVQRFLDGLPTTAIDLIVIDTLARSMVGGDESSAKDMGQVIETCEEFIRCTGATVVISHHPGHNKTRERGSTALRSAVDTMITIGGGETSRHLKWEKQRDAVLRDDVPFTLMPHRESALVTSRPGIGATTPGPTPKQLEALKSLQSAGVVEGLTNAEWKRASGLPGSTFEDARKCLHSNGFVIPAGKGRGSKYTISTKGEKLLLQSSTFTPSKLQMSNGSSLHTEPPPFRGGPDGVTELSELCEENSTDSQRKEAAEALRVERDEVKALLSGTDQ